MEEMITLCGDNCVDCPRYVARTEEEKHEAAILWNKIGWQDSVVSNEEISCTGGSSHKTCTYHLVECIKEHGVEKCNQCSEFPCSKINIMLERSVEYEKKCRQVCTKEEYQQIANAFFHKEENLKK